MLERDTRVDLTGDLKVTIKPRAPGAAKVSSRRSFATPEHPLRVRAVFAAEAPHGLRLVSRAGHGADTRLRDGLLRAGARPAR